METKDISLNLRTRRGLSQEALVARFGARFLWLAFQIENAYNEYMRKT